MSNETKIVDTVFGKIEVPKDFTMKVKGYYHPCGELPEGAYFNFNGDLVKLNEKGEEIVIETKEDRIARQRSEAKQGK